MAKICAFEGCLVFKRSFQAFDFKLCCGHLDGSKFLSIEVEYNCQPSMCRSWGRGRDFEMILYIFQNCTYFDQKKNLREIYEDTQKLEQGVLETPKIWERESPGNLARVSNLWPGTLHPKILNQTIRQECHQINDARTPQGGLKDPPKFEQTNKNSGNQFMTNNLEKYWKQIHIHKPLTHRLSNLLTKLSCSTILQIPQNIL